MEADTGAVARFVERLAAFRPSNWLAVAEAVQRNAPAHRAASAALPELIVRHGLAVDAWVALDDVQTAAHASLASAWPFGRSRREAARIHVARCAADAAGLALLMRARLGADAFDVLYAPFAVHGPRLVRPTAVPEPPAPNAPEPRPAAPGMPVIGQPRPRRLATWRRLVFRVLARIDAHGETPYGIPAERVQHVDVPLHL